MNCHHCEKEIPHGQAILVWEPDEMTKRFCALDCIRAWLGPDRPLNRRLKELEKELAPPQPVVVGQPHKYVSRTSRRIVPWKDRLKRGFYE